MLAPSMGNRPNCRRIARLALLLLVLPTFPATGSSLRETSDFADVVAVVAEYAGEYGGDHVLLACDLDNTLLAMDSALGSDQWFEWQSHLLSTHPRSSALVARDFAGLLDVQGALFDLTPMHLTQPNLPLLLGRVQGMGVRTIVLTARGDDFRGATEFELNRHGLDFASHALKLADDRGDEDSAAKRIFFPYDMVSLERSGITRDEAALWKLTVNPAPVSYGKGVYMVAGQHKGAMLAALLNRAAHSLEAVVFVDQDRQVRRTFDALVRRDYEVTAFEYLREDERVKAFQYSHKTTVTREWARLKRALSPRNGAGDRAANGALTGGTSR